MLRFHDGIDYDLRHKNFTIDLSFWLQIANRYGADILELGCGTGRITVPLALEGFAMDGIDIEESMLNVAKNKASQENLNINFTLSDFREFDINKKFDLIILPFCSMGHILNLQDFEKTMSCIKEHLKPNGKFVFDLYNPNLEILTRPSDNTYILTKYKDKDNNEIIMKEKNTYDNSTQINYITFYYERNGEIDDQDEYVMKIYFPKEIDALIKYNGFKIDEKLGDFNFNSFSKSSMRQIFICSKN